ncbi:hypothetical protein [Pararhizobium sp.]|uniref:hypothetical protein n=1 Tax=Pararhizobium sp. TaxID=1977563 RepID=UPI003D0FB039
MVDFDYVLRNLDGSVLSFPSGEHMVLRQVVSNALINTSQEDIENPRIGKARYTEEDAIRRVELATRIYGATEPIGLTGDEAVMLKTAVRNAQTVYVTALVAKYIDACQKGEPPALQPLTADEHPPGPEVIPEEQSL